jgi:hypothetical protein
MCMIIINCIYINCIYVYYLLVVAVLCFFIPLIMRNLIIITSHERWNPPHLSSSCPIRKDL